jgi:homeobox protein engrailed
VLECFFVENIMALEDRFSPQTAPSPPHQNQNQITSATMISPTHEEMSLVVPISPLHIKQEINEQPQNIPFSITNILSDTFGKVTPTHIPAGKQNGSPTTEKKDSLFRPYDITKSPSYEPPAASPHHHHPHHHQLLMLNNANRLNEIYDLSRKSYNGLVDPRTASLFNGFSASAYPKLHEEIINSHRKFQEKLLESQIKAQQQHIPPLGSLCKTVSQIGQLQPNNLTANPAGNGCNSRSSSVSPKIATTPKPQTLMTTTPQPKSSLDNTLSSNDGMESSDDARSETSSTKDGDGNLWPAWVYCTRYSDRPSSGEFPIFFVRQCYCY